MPDNRILIVDNRKENIELFQSLLSDLDYTVDYCLDPETTNAMCREHAYDLIILDIRMPVDGFEVLECVKKTERNENTPYIFVAEKTDLENIKKAYQMGCNDVITRPFEVHEVLSKISVHSILNHQYNQLKSLMAAKEKFNSIIAHDLRSPFNALIGLSELLLDNYEKNNFESTRSFAEKINIVAKQTLSLLDDLLKYSASQKEKVVYRPQKVNLYSVFDESYSSLMHTAGIKQIELKNYIEHDLNVEGDRNMLGTLLRNLVNNAIKFTPDFGWVEVYGRKEFNEVVVEVVDSGIGMEASVLENLFKIDNRISTRGTNGEQGTGFGLLLCKEIIEKHKGSIAAYSAPDKGSKFVVRLPEVNDR